MNYWVFAFGFNVNIYIRVKISRYTVIYIRYVPIVFSHNIRVFYFIRITKILDDLQKKKKNVIIFMVSTSKLFEKHLYVENNCISIEETGEYMIIDQLN